MEELFCEPNRILGFLKDCGCSIGDVIILGAEIGPS
jgi:hypothetical protein